MTDGTSLASPPPPPPPFADVGTTVGTSDIVKVGVAGTAVEGVDVVAVATGAVVGAVVKTGMATGAPVAATTGADVGEDLHPKHKSHEDPLVGEETNARVLHGSW